MRRTAKATPRLTMRACFRDQSSRRLAVADTTPAAKYQYPRISRTAATTGLKGSREERRKDGVDQSTPPVTNTNTAQARHMKALSSRAVRKKIDCRLS
jgi:hypothetical protein